MNEIQTVLHVHEHFFLSIQDFFISLQLIFTLNSESGPCCSIERARIPEIESTLNDMGTINFYSDLIWASFIDIMEEMFLQENID